MNTKNPLLIVILFLASSVVLLSGTACVNTLTPKPTATKSTATPTVHPGGGVYVPAISSSLIGPELKGEDMWAKGVVNSKHFLTPTNLELSQGDILDMKASGLVGWGEWKSGPDMWVRHTWGLWYGIREPDGTIDKFLYAGSSLSIVSHIDGILYLVIPEGREVGYSPTDDFLYSDNSGQFQVTISVRREE